MKNAEPFLCVLRRQRRVIQHARDLSHDRLALVVDFARVQLHERGPRVEDGGNEKRREMERETERGNGKNDREKRRKKERKSEKKMKKSERKVIAY